jgi:hypothetical protein
MLFKFAWQHSPSARDTTIKKFMETGGMPPEGLTMLSRYHNVDGSGGFIPQKRTTLPLWQIGHWTGMD